LLTTKEARHRRMDLLMSAEAILASAVVAWSVVSVENGVAKVSADGVDPTLSLKRSMWTAMD
jgi:hypothetical protein